MMLMVHLKDEVEPAQVLLTLINLSKDVIQVTKHTMIRIPWLCADYQELQNLKYAT